MSFDRVIKLFLFAKKKIDKMSLFQNAKQKLAVDQLRIAGTTKGVRMYLIIHASCKKKRQKDWIFIIRTNIKSDQ